MSPSALTDREPLEINCDGVIYLLRNLGPHTDRELMDSLGIGLTDLVEATSSLHVAGRIERHGTAGRFGDRWRLVPGGAIAENPRRRRDLSAHRARQSRSLLYR